MFISVAGLYPLPRAAGYGATEAVLLPPPARLVKIYSVTAL